MPILYSVIARGSTVLAKYASCAGNFSEVTEQILTKIPPENSKLTYSHGSFYYCSLTAGQWPLQHIIFKWYHYLFHYVCEDRIIYLCITDDDFERAKAFLYLNEIKKKFSTQYGVRAQTALPYAMNSEFSRVQASQMKYYSESGGTPDQLEKVKGQVDELKGIMVRNIDQIADRGERLELLIDKTDDLSSNAVSFKKTSRNLARSLWWKNIKITIIIVVVVIVVLYFIISAACGGMDWPCTRKK